MPSPVLRLTGVIVAAAIAAAAFTGPALPTTSDGYQAAVKAICGIVTIAGSLCLAAAIGRTFLRSGGIDAFKAAYVAATGLSGLGLAEALSAFYPVNIGNALLSFCMVSAISGILWVRFYGCAV